jgi:hypothetical protein
MAKRSRPPSDKSTAAGTKRTIERGRREVKAKIQRNTQTTPDLLNRIDEKRERIEDERRQAQDRRQKSRRAADREEPSPDRRERQDRRRE